MDILRSKAELYKGEVTWKRPQPHLSATQQALRFEVASARIFAARTVPTQAQLPVRNCDGARRSHTPADGHGAPLTVP